MLHKFYCPKTVFFAVVFFELAFNLILIPSRDTSKSLVNEQLLPQCMVYISLCPSVTQLLRGRGAPTNKFEQNFTLFEQLILL